MKDISFDIKHGIKRQLSSFLEQVKAYPCYSEIEEKMKAAM